MKSMISREMNVRTKEKEFIFSTTKKVIYKGEDINKKKRFLAGIA